MLLYVISLALNAVGTGPDSFKNTVRTSLIALSKQTLTIKTHSKLPSEIPEPPVKMAQQSEIETFDVQYERSLGDAARAFAMPNGAFQRYRVHPVRSETEEPAVTYPELNFPIHPIFAQNQFRQYSYSGNEVGPVWDDPRYDFNPEIYKMMKPGLSLASALLQRSLPIYQKILCAKKVGHNQAGGYWLSDAYTPTGKDRQKLNRAFEWMSQNVPIMYFMRDNNDPVFLKAVGDAKHVAGLTHRRVLPSTGPSIFLSIPFDFHYIFNDRYWIERSTEQNNRSWAILAVILVHEFAHAMCYYRGLDKHIEAWLVGDHPVYEFEPRFSRHHNFNELGNSIEKELFGGTWSVATYLSPNRPGEYDMAFDGTKPLVIEQVSGHVSDQPTFVTCEISNVTINELFNSDSWGLVDGRHKLLHIYIIWRLTPMDNRGPPDSIGMAYYERIGRYIVAPTNDNGQAFVLPPTFESQQNPSPRLANVPPLPELPACSPPEWWETTDPNDLFRALRSKLGLPTDGR